MKLIFCPDCQDVISLRQTENYRTCVCGRSGGRYINSLGAELTGKAIPVGFANSSFSDALNNQPENGQGELFVAFVIPKNCLTVTYTNKKEAV